MTVAIAGHAVRREVMDKVLHPGKVGLAPGRGPSIPELIRLDQCNTGGIILPAHDRGV